jgi:phospholipid/cholesterol/gamma-HCH transport system ATP-binding protein
LEPDSGHVDVDGVNITTANRKQLFEVRMKFGVLFQGAALFDSMTVAENIGLGLREHTTRTDQEISARVEECLVMVHLPGTEKLMPSELSGGMKKRIGLARAIAMQPQYILYDEPTTGLDPQSRRELHAAITRMKHDGYTVVFTTHYLDEAEQLCDRVAIIDRGRIVASGAPRELIAQSKGVQTITLATSRPIEPAKIAQLPGVESGENVKVDGATASFPTRNATATLAALMHLLDEGRIELRDLQVRKASLEDVFLQLTKENAGAATPAPQLVGAKPGEGAASPGADPHA